MSKWTEMWYLFCSVPDVFFSQYRCGSRWWGIGSRAAAPETSGRNTREPRPGWCYKTNPPATRLSSTPRLPTQVQSYGNNPIMLLWAHKVLICRNTIWQHMENHRIPQKTATREYKRCLCVQRKFSMFHSCKNKPADVGMLAWQSRTYQKYLNENHIDFHWGGENFCTECLSCLSPAILNDYPKHAKSY